MSDLIESSLQLIILILALTIPFHLYMVSFKLKTDIKKLEEKVNFQYKEYCGLLKDYNMYKQKNR